jgi:hypothetical protein
VPKLCPEHKRILNNTEEKILTLLEFAFYDTFLQMTYTEGSLNFNMHGVCHHKNTILTSALKEVTQCGVFNSQRSDIAIMRFQETAGLEQAGAGLGSRIWEET